MTAVAKLCGVARQSVYTWIEEWRVERLIDALKLARVSGIPIERLAGDAFKPEKIPFAKSSSLVCQHRSESTSTHRSKNASVEGAMVWASGFLTRGCARGNRPLAAAKNLTS